LTEAQRRSRLPNKPAARAFDTIAAKSDTLEEKCCSQRSAFPQQSFALPKSHPEIWTEILRIAIASKDFTEVSSHAGQTSQWLVYDSDRPDFPERVTLQKDQLIHHFKEHGPHPLDGVELVIAASAGDGFFRHMAKRGAEVVLTGERDARRALAAVLAGQVLPDVRFDPTTLLCKVRDLFSRH
jgi:predicted Fe-Mo cluster-binding NifX family protein